MLLLIISVIVFAIGMYLTGKTHITIGKREFRLPINCVDGYLHIGVTMVAFLLMMALLFPTVFNNGFDKMYSQDADFQLEVIQLAMTNENITEVERLNAIESTIDYNRAVLRARRIINSIWVGKVIEQHWADRELIDIKEIKTVKYNVIIKDNGIINE